MNVSYENGKKLKSHFTKNQGLFINILNLLFFLILIMYINTTLYMRIIICI